MKRLILLLAAAAALCPGSVRTQSALDVLHYRATIAFDIANRTIDAVAELHIRNDSIAPIHELALDLRDLTVDGVERNGAALVATHDNAILLITLDADLAAGDSTWLKISYHGTPVAEDAAVPWGGCFWGDPSFSIGVGFRAPYVSMTRHWLPSHDVPGDKATFDMTYIVPRGYEAAGMGALAGVRDTTGDRTAWHWIESHPTATYHCSYAIGHYAKIDGMWNSVPTMIFVLKKDSLRATNWFQPLSTMLDVFSRVYGPYPFDKVGYCLTPIGSMEHQTMISLDQGVFDYYGKAGLVVAHELAHQWWGACVTPKDFREAWLSEGFATFSESVYSENTTGRSLYLSSIRSLVTQYRNSIEPAEGSFPLYDFPRAEPSSNYPTTIYYKGALVLAMLRQMLGDGPFFAGLLDFRAAHEYGNATTEDLRASLEKTSGKALDWFFREWVYSPGYPNYLVQRVKDSTGAPLRVRLRQLQDTTRVPLFRMPLPLMIVKTTGDTLRDTIETQAAAMQEFSFPTVKESDVKSITIDPEGIILKQVSYQTVGTGTVPQSAPQGFRLDQNYPNPFSRNAMTTIPFSMSTAAHVRLDVVDQLGRSCAMLADGWYAPGEFSVDFTPSRLAPGVYFVRMSVRGAQAARMIAVE